MVTAVSRSRSGPLPSFLPLTVVIIYISTAFLFHLFCALFFEGFWLLWEPELLSSQERLVIMVCTTLYSRKYTLTSYFLMLTLFVADIMLTDEVEVEIEVLK